MANWAGSAIDGLLCYCRAGFEPELAGELTERAAQAGFAGYARTERNTGHVLFVCDDADALSRSLPWSTLIFARRVNGVALSASQRTVASGLVRPRRDSASW